MKLKNVKVLILPILWFVALALASAALLLAGCVNMDMVWDGTTTYKALDIVLVWDEAGQWHTTYASLQDNNRDHYPPSSPDWWGR